MDKKWKIKTFDFIVAFFTMVTQIYGYAILREVDGDIIYHTMNCDPDTTIKIPAGCQCVQPKTTMYEVTSGRYCSELGDKNTPRTIVYDEGCESGAIDQMNIHAKCTPKSPTIEVRNKAASTPAYWDETFHNSLKRLFVIENRNVGIENGRGELNGLLVKYSYLCHGEHKKRCHILKFSGAQNYPYKPINRLMPSTTTTSKTTTTATTKTIASTTTTPTTTTRTTTTTTPTTTPLKNKTRITMQNTIKTTLGTVVGARNTTNDANTKEEEALFPIIVGVAAAGVTALLIIVIVLCCKSRQKKDKEKESEKTKPIEREDSGYSSPHQYKIDPNENSFKSYIQESPEYQALHHKHSPSQYRSLESAFKNGGYSDIQNPDQLPVYGVLEEEGGLYEEAQDYQKIEVPPPIYGELEKEPGSQPIYGELEKTDPDYQKCCDQPIYGEIEDDTNYYHEAAIYNKLEENEPEYKALDDIYVNNAQTLDMVDGPESADKPRLAPKPKFIPPLSPEIPHKIARKDTQLYNSSTNDVYDLPSPC